MHLSFYCLNKKMAILITKRQPHIIKKETNFSQKIFLNAGIQSVCGRLEVIQKSNSCDNRHNHISIFLNSNLKYKC